MIRPRLYLATIVILILVLFNVFFILKSTNHDTGIRQGLAAEPFIIPVSEASYLPALNTNIASPEIKSRAAIVYDVNSTKHLYAKNIEEKLPIASLTKIMTAVVVLDKLNLKDIVTIPAEALKVDGQVQDLFLDEKLTVEDLLKLMLIKSSNDAAYALVQYAGKNNIDLIKEMNKKAFELRMLDSYFKDPAGLNDEAYSTAEDLVKLVNHSLAYPKLWDIVSRQTETVRSLSGIEHNVQTTNQLLGQLPGVIGGKTGYTEDALGCMILLVQVSDKGDKIISIILGSPERFTDSRRLVEWSTQAYRWK